MNTQPHDNPIAGGAAASELALPGSTAASPAAPSVTAVPDAAVIAQLANILFNGDTPRPFPGPGAALPSAHVFAAEPLYSSIPGAPALQPPLLPNHNPGLPALPLPTSGAAQPAAQIFAVEPLTEQPLPAGGAENAQSLHENPLGAASTARSVPAHTPHGNLGEADFASLPNRLSTELSLVPNLAATSGSPIAYVVPNAFDPGASEGYAFLERAGMPAQTELGSGSDPVPLSSNRPTVSAAGGNGSTRSDSAARPSSFISQFDVSTLDLSGLSIQHRPNIDGSGFTGRRPFDAHAIRRDFPILHQDVNGKPLVWLDNGATTQKPQSVIDRLSHFYAHENSNIHRGAHTLAARSTDAYEDARAKVTRFINAPSPDSIIFVRGTTEGLNLIAQAWGRRNVGEGDEIVLTHLEHHANIVPWQQLAAEKGAVIKVAPVDDTGQIILEEYERLFTPKTLVASFSQVSNALGTVTPVAEMVAIAHRHGALAIVDGAQSISHMPIDVQALDADFFVFSGHKMFAPTGIGAVYGRPSILETMPPWQGGGNMIQDVTFEKTTFQGPPGRFEAGTGNIADAVGLGAAIDYLASIGMENIAAYEHGLLDYLTHGLLSVPGLRIIGTANPKAGVASFVLDECRVEDVGKALAAEGIAVRAGHHCAQPILRRFGLEATVRPSLALYNTTDDVDALINALRRIQIGRGKARH